MTTLAADDTTSIASGQNGTTGGDGEMYQQQIENLKEQLALKDQQMNDLQRGLEAQVHMVMELEELEQKELREFELKIDANKRLIAELGDRVGQESKQKAELESELSFTQKKCKDQETQIARLEELNKVNTDLLKEFKAQDSATTSASNAASNGQGNKWEVYSKLDFMMESNQKLVLELAQAQEDMQKVRREVSDKELLCLELSSQLDKLASQLNTADEDMAGVRNEVNAKEKALKRTEERVQMLEKSMLDAPEGDDKQGLSLLMRKFKEKEEQCDQMQRERDASLAKATKLSLALASSREHVDALQEKLDYQNSIVDRILGKRNTNPVTNIVSSATPTHEKPRRHSSGERGGLRRSLSATGSALMGRATNSNNNASSNASTTSNANFSTSAKPAPFDGRRIRNFFNRGRTLSSGPAATAASASSSSANSPSNAGAAANNSTNNSPTSAAAAAATSSPTSTTPPPAAAAAPPRGGLFQRKSSGGGEEEKAAATATATESAAAAAKSSSKDLSSVLANGTDTSNPFDDDNSAMFTNESVGKVDQLEEDCQGGGGAVNLALTL